MPPTGSTRGLRVPEKQELAGHPTDLLTSVAPDQQVRSAPARLGVPNLRRGARQRVGAGDFSAVIPVVEKRIGRRLPAW